MSDEQLLQNVRKLIDACLSSGLIKTLPDADGLQKFYTALVDRLNAVHA